MQVSGLSSGLDTANIIQQLMSVERMAGKGLTTGKSKAQTLLSAFQSLNGLMKSFQDAATAVMPDLLAKTSPWTMATAVSSRPELATVTTASGASAGSLTFTVNKLATTASVISGTSFDGKALVNDANGGAAFQLTLTTASGNKTIDVKANAVMADVQAAINDANFGAKATMVQVAPDQYRLQVQSTTGGAAGSVAVSGGPFGTFDTLSSGQDAEITLGDATTGVKITSPTNTFKDVVPGVTVTAVKADPTTPVTVDVKSDVEGIAGKVKAMVDAANQVLDNMKKNSEFNGDSKKGGVFLGDSTVRQLQSMIAKAFVGTAAANPALAGVALDKDGQVVFDQAKFTAAYTKDPVAVEKALTDTADKLATVGKQATDPADGMLTVRIRGEENSVKDYTKQIAKFEDRMSLRQQVLERQFAALETMLSKLQAQGNWLAGQLKSLPTQSSNND